MGAVSSYTLDTADASDFLLGTDSTGTVKRFDVGEFFLANGSVTLTGNAVFTPASGTALTLNTGAQTNITSLSIANVGAGTSGLLMTAYDGGGLSINPAQAMDGAHTQIAIYSPNRTQWYEVANLAYDSSPHAFMFTQSAGSGRDVVRIKNKDATGDLLRGVDSADATVFRLTVAGGGVFSGPVTSGGILTTSAGVIDAGTVLTRIETTGATAPTGSAGQGLDIWNSGMQSRNRTSATWGGFDFGADNFKFKIAGTDKFTIDNSGNAVFVGTVTVPDDAAAGTWNGSALVPTKNAVYDAFVALSSAYRCLLDCSGSHIAARVAGTYGFGHGDPLAISGTGTLYPLDVLYIDPADYPTFAGLTAKLRVRCTLAVNDVAPTGNYTIALHPVTRPATSGGAGLNIYTIGAAVASSGVTSTAPAADSINNLVGADFALPAAGHYIIGMVSTATVAASSHLHLSASLQLHYT